MTTDRDEKGRFGPGNRDGVQFKDGNIESIKHGGHSFLKTGEVPDNLPWKAEIEKELDDLRKGLIADLGGEAMITTGQELLINQIVSLTGFTRLVDVWIKESGSPFITDDKGDVKVKSALSTFYLACINSTRLNLGLLGLHKPRTFDRATPFEIYMSENEIKDETEKD